MSLGRLYGKVKKKSKSLSRRISFPINDNKWLKNGKTSDKFSAATNQCQSKGIENFGNCRNFKFWSPVFV